MRPTSIEAMCKGLQGFETEEGVRRGLEYQPGPTELFISPYAKCGTTWMQQIVHGLRTGGAMAFSEITEVVPWLELAHDMGTDVNAPQVVGPRAFKSHLNWEDIPKGGKYIVVLRDPLDAFISFYRFFEGWHFEAGSISLSEFADFYLDRPNGKSYWGHAASWWRVRDRDDVILFTFENMKTDLAGTVDAVADFMSPSPNDKARKIATEQAGFAFMKENGRQFDDHLLRAARDPACGLPPGGIASKVNAGKVGGEKALITPEIRDKFSERWRKTMTAEFGLNTYSEIISALK